MITPEEDRICALCGKPCRYFESYTCTPLPGPMPVWKHGEPFDVWAKRRDRAAMASVFLHSRCV